MCVCVCGNASLHVRRCNHQTLSEGHSRCSCDSFWAAQVANRSSPIQPVRFQTRYSVSFSFQVTKVTKGMTFLEFVDLTFQVAICLSRCGFSVRTPVDTKEPCLAANTRPIASSLSSDILLLIRGKDTRIWVSVLGPQCLLSVSRLQHCRDVHLGMCRRQEDSRAAI